MPSATAPKRVATMLQNANAAPIRTSITEA
jgi:hypothetical protein